MLVLLIFAVLGASVMYLLASIRPSNYHPARHLSESEKQAVANAFVQEAYVKFQNRAGQNKPFTWTFTQHRLNEYLASMDEIVANAPGHRPGEVNAVMDKYALAAPAVALDDGEITLMVRSRRYDKIISGEFSFSLWSHQQGGKKVLTVAFDGMRVGSLPVPKAFVEDYLTKAQRSLAKRYLLESKKDVVADKSAPISSAMNKLIEFVSSVILVVDGGAVEPVFSFPDAHGRKKMVRIDKIDIDDGELTLHVVPVKTE